VSVVSTIMVLRMAAIYWFAGFIPTAVLTMLVRTGKEIAITISTRMIQA
jgi:hypothetical protein